MTLVIEKLISGGQGLAKKDGKTYLVWNALPGETVEVKIVGKARSVYEAMTTKIVSESPERVRPLEAHYLSCSPWQILRFDAENRWKEKIAAETYERLGGLTIDSGLSIDSDGQQTGYRNKIEYGFCRKPEGLSFSFFERNSHSKIPVLGCDLACEKIQKAADETLAWLKAEGIPEACLKELVIRSGEAPWAIAGLFLNEDLGIKTHPPLDGALKGFQIFYGQKNILSAGENELAVRLNGTTLAFGLFSFFQINVPVFEKALTAMGEFLDPSKACVDLYAGVGAISLGLNAQIRQAHLADENAQAIEFAKKNINANALKNFTAVQARAESLTRFIQKESLLIVDPPRAGLDAKLIRRILTEKPCRILYLSCDIATQARDLKLLVSGGYRVKALKLYNFFPRTPHIEALAVLDC